MTRISLVVLLGLVALLCGCLSENERPAERIKVIATIAPLAEMAKAVGADKVEVFILVPPGAEPHTFEPAPSQMKRLAEADLYIKNGAGLEFWLDNILQVNEKMAIVDSSKGVSLLGESKEEMDPHVWLSLRSAAVQVENICEGLIQIDPANKGYYLSNRDNYLQKLRALDFELNKTFASKEKRIFIVHHPAWTYFARDYRLEQISLMENEKEPGPKHMGQVISLSRKNNITSIFVEPQFNQKSAEVIAREMNGKIVYLDPLAANYLENMRYAGEKIAESLRA